MRRGEVTLATQPTSPQSLGKAVSSHGIVGPCPLIFSWLSHALQKSGNSIARTPRGCFPIFAQPVPLSRATSLLLPCLPAHSALHPKDGCSYLGLCLLILGVWNPQAQSYTAAPNSMVFANEQLPAGIPPYLAQLVSHRFQGWYLGQCLSLTLETLTCSGKNIFSTTPPQTRVSKNPSKKYPSSFSPTSNLWYPRG